jgi:hypothetical protein
MVATSAGIDLFQNLQSVFLGHAFFQYFFFHIFAHKVPPDQHIMLAMPYETFHLAFILRNLYRGEIPDERFSPVYAGGQNRSDQLVCRWLFSHGLLFLLDGWLDKVMNKNSMGNRCPG